MEAQVEQLVQEVWENYKECKPSQRVLVGVAGIPGSGKTTLAAKVVSRLNELYRMASPGTSAGGSTIAAFVPMDGYHLTRAQLSAMPDPAMAHARRGAAFTFDGEAYAKFVKALRDPIVPESRTLFAPSFDHARKDPVADDISIAKTIRVVVFEGNYVLLARNPWSDAAAMMEHKWFVDVDFDVARSRLVKRHVQAGIAVDEAAAHKRVTENDLVNGEEIVGNLVEPYTTVKSIEDKSWEPEEQGLNS